MRTENEHSADAAATCGRRPNTDRTEAAIQQLAPLRPAEPPGRATRKARHYLDQIVRLRGQGYTLEAIQQALAAVGVSVSISTVRREAMRPMPAPFPAPLPSSASHLEDVSVPEALPTTPLSTVLGPSSGKDLAEAYARSRSTNPLVRAKEHMS